MNYMLNSRHSKKDMDTAEFPVLIKTQALPNEQEGRENNTIELKGQEK